ncbi:MAG: TonB system transport protein ExbD [Rouxiella aceris]|mgnify:CR=1 FL=1|jgi:biopolymer transport protein ExbD|uniref:Biopolymer transport protein ExbD n=1 Tax=Rouxiella aceris TaxID=2703884 RepID=A0A848MC91_9GAMM|nr:TonB system transport protein ExbD [Rouxiella aceris]MDR3434579.1 TonB system transport protein ExbD [Rouxiella aceris]NMP25727.1 TonB system transport protein ExbD [Rouxiella aceris]
MAIRLNDDFDESGEMHDINVTPFIDVMLVLLIIFMVAAPLATVDVRVNLPASSAQSQPRPPKPLFLTVKADNQMFLGDEPVTAANLSGMLNQRTQGDKQTTIFFRADKSVNYATIMSVMDNLRTAGYLKVGLVGEEKIGAAAH